MGWLLATLFCGITALAGFTSLIFSRLDKNEIIPTALLTLISGYLSYFFMQQYKRKKMHNVIEEDEKIKALENGLPVVEESSIFLKGDILHYLEPATLLVTEKKVIGRSGSGGGISIRLAKGIYARTGSFGGKPIYGDITSRFYGQLAITNNRLIFIHRQKGFEIRLKDISLIKPYSNGVSIQSKSKSYSFLIKEPRYLVELIKKILDNNSEALA